MRRLSFEELISAEGNCVSKSASLIFKGKFTSQNRLGYLIVQIVGRKFMSDSVICRKFLLKLALRTSLRSMAVLVGRAK